jgi:hypothetical protein
LGNKYPENIMKYLRLREGLEADDTSLDEDLNILSSKEAFREVCRWNGLLGGWDDTIKGWIKNIYGIDLDRIEK